MKRIFNISTGADPEAPEQVLSVRLGEHHFGFAITSSQSANELISLAWYAGEDTWEHELEELYMAHPELGRSFSKILIAYDHPQSILIPLNSYTGNDRLLLETMYGVNGSHAILSEDVAGWQLKNIFAVPHHVKDWARRYFSSGSYHHSYSIGIKLIDSTNFEGSIQMDFRSQDFTLVASKANRLLMAQTFTYTTPADVIYYLVKICQEFGFTQQAVKLSLSGLIEKESNLYRELVQYFLNIRFREPAWQIPAEGEEHHPPHFFTSFNDLSVCES